MTTPDRTAGWPIRWIFITTILAGSFLLFLVQPMVARMALPQLGGAPAVWNSAMLVYQALLLGGYAYAHLLGKLMPKAQAAVHILLLLCAAVWLPIGVNTTPTPAAIDPALWTPWLLAASIGPLFFAVSAHAPLLQRWFAFVCPGRDPYALYAASNVGSFAGLLAYPLLVEPLLPLRVQSWGWSIGYALLFLLVIGCGWLLPHRREQAVPLEKGDAPGRRRVLHWIVLALVPSGLMLATSTFLTTDIVAVPLLWVLPLGLYLLSFTVAFAARRGLADAITRYAPITILVFGGMMIGGNHAFPLLSALAALLLLFAVSVTLHAHMYALRPAPGRLTGFYLAMSVGGALGGAFAGLVAPVLFDWTYEYPLLILAAGMLAPLPFLLPATRQLWVAGGVKLRVATILVIGALVAVAMANPGGMLGAKPDAAAFFAIVAVGLFAIGARAPFVFALASALFVFGGYRAISLSLEPGARTRSYFGVYTIMRGQGVNELQHGTTLHGIQLTGTPARERTPTTYYVPNSGVGEALRAAPSLYGRSARIGIVGLGTGTLACYARPGQHWRFYEIDPVVVRIARDSGAFTFLRRCAPDAQIAVGDARLTLSEEPAGSLDLLALDAFSSDAVPMHLMTREAFDTYGRVLGRRGLLLVHVSNRYLDLGPVVARTAVGWTGAQLAYQSKSTDPNDTGSLWIALTRDPAVLSALLASGGQWESLPATDAAPWTDDYASILPVLRALR
ncbi:fused MFS/spermidine synthase [Sphingomonas sp. Leaf23]|uniref:fused MFS/spermidine synthase n=1 Tax=Sphingomonas sp. Leaf23 TaxID=1735689 RepID=UPI0009EBB6FE|nr:fused MFS/spermidine synthase [Sphingomonas sp. Leaf23]